MKAKNNQLKIKAALTLGLLTPVLGEILTGSSPPLHFFRPVFFLFLLGMYGCGILLLRDLARTRNLGWINIAILGLAYGMIEEGLIITSFYNPEWGGVKPLAGHGFFIGINWIWAIYSSFTHVFLTVFSSIVLVESLFPRLADKPWLTSKQRWICGLFFAVAFIFGYHLFVNTLYPSYTPPVFSYLLIVFITAITGFLGLKIPKLPELERISPASHHFRYLLIGLILSLLSIILPYSLSKLEVPSLLTVLLLVGLILGGGYLIVSWVKRFNGWTAADRLSLASGVMTPWLIRMPLLELGIMQGVRQMNMSGMTVAAIIVVGLLWKGFRTIQLEHMSSEIRKSPAQGARR